MKVTAKQSMVALGGVAALAGGLIWKKKEEQLAAMRSQAVDLKRTLERESRRAQEAVARAEQAVHSSQAFQARAEQAERMAQSEKARSAQLQIELEKARGQLKQSESRLAALDKQTPAVQ